MRKTLKLASISLTGAWIACGLTGCNTCHYATLPAVGPDPTAQTQGHRHGWLEVYTASANTACGQSTLQPSYTDYTIYLDDSWFCVRVHNSRNGDPARPKSVKLPAGTFNVSAQAKDANGGTFNLVIPAVIEAGRATTMHLDGEWRPWDLGASAQLVRLPSGEPVGWSASND